MSEDEEGFLEETNQSERVRSYRDELSRQRGREVSLDEAVRHWIQEHANRWLGNREPDPSGEDD